MTETYIDIDSTYRDRKLFSNPCDMIIERSNQIRDNINNARNVICDSIAIPIRFSISDIIKEDDYIIFKINKLYTDIQNFRGQYLQFNYGFGMGVPMQVCFLKIIYFDSDYIKTEKPYHTLLPESLYDSSSEHFKSICYTFKLRKTLPIYPRSGSEQTTIMNDSKKGSVCSVSVVNPGKNYKNMDKLKIVGGDNNCIVKVVLCKNTMKNVLEVIEPGSGYLLKEYSAIAYNGGQGVGCTVNIERTGIMVEIKESIQFDHENNFFDTKDKTCRIIKKFRNCIIIPEYTIPKSCLKKGSCFDILEFTEDGVKDMKPMNSGNKQVEMTLVNLSIPNQFYPNFYPYLCVEFYSGSNRRTTYHSNNPNLNGVTFKCIMHNVNEYDKYISLSGINSTKTTFNNSENITFRIRTPDGEVLKFNSDDNRLPFRPNENLQVNAIFHIRTLSN